MLHKVAPFLVVAMLASSPSYASVVEFTDKAEWEAAVGGYTTIDFILPPSGTLITNQHSHMGVTFGDFVFSHESGGYLNDGWGMRGIGGAWVHFDAPQRYIGIDFSGIAMLDLYYHNELIHTTMIFGGGGLGFFGGVHSSIGIDAVYIYRPEPHINKLFIDDLHFGNVIPAPGALGLLALVAKS